MIPAIIAIKILATATLMPMTKALVEKFNYDYFYYIIVS